jgi:uncharacterized protein
MGIRKSAGAWFNWNPRKAAQNRSDHRVSFEEAMTAFMDPLARIHDDPSHSESERRELLVGHSDRHRLLVVSFTERGGGVRIISARRATRREREDYEAR